MIISLNSSDNAQIRIRCRNWLKKTGVLFVPVTPEADTRKRGTFLKVTSLFLSNILLHTG